MNIAVVGHKMYDFQDLCCVDVFLHYSDEQHVNLRIEPAGREDAALSFEPDGRQLCFDIQI